ncbi:MAG: hypothetical protein ACOCQQ_02560 [Candidatus Nanoarchaeia archaeon]
MEAWHKKAGYYKNPFICNPHKEQFSFLGNEEKLDKTIYYITSGSILFVEGEAGSGKTKFLKKIIARFRGRVIYLDAQKILKTVNIEDVLRKRNGFFASLGKKLPKDNIVFIDNVTDLPLVNMERLKYYYDQGHIQSIVFAGEKLSKANLPESMVSRIGKRVIKLDSFNYEKAIAMVQERLGEDVTDEESVISVEYIKRIFDSSKKNPRRFLVNLHRIFEEMIMNEDSSVKEEHLIVLKDILDKEEVEEFEKELGLVRPKGPQKTPAGGKILKVGNYYRNPDEDIFCSNCGAIVEPGDVSCPECHAVFENQPEIIVEKKPSKKKPKDEKKSKQSNKKNNKKRKDVTSSAKKSSSNKASENKKSSSKQSRAKKSSTKKASTKKSTKKKSSSKKENKGEKK